MPNILPFTDDLIKSDGIASPLIENEQKNSNWIQLNFCNKFNLLTFKLRKCLTYLSCFPEDDLEQSSDYQSLNFDENVENQHIANNQNNQNNQN